MAEKRFVSDLEDNSYVQTSFLVADKSARVTKNGDPYLCVTLADRSGEIEARVWDDVEAIAGRFEIGDFVVVRAQTSSYKGELQLKIDDLGRLDDDEVDKGDYFPQSRWPGTEMLAQLRDLVAREVKSSDMLRFFDAFFSDDELMRRFVIAPAAKSNHHAYLGGLLEHTLSMSRIAVRLTRHYTHYYPGLLNQDLVIAGCILHDVGKCYELTFDRAFEYSDEGKLVGHIVQGVELITELAAPVHPPLPAEMITQLKHLVLSHHGKMEYGSPVRPKSPEALLLHEIDMIDSRMNMLHNIVEEHENGLEPDASWTSYQRLFSERLYMGDESTKNWAKLRKPRTDELAGPGFVPDPTPAKQADADAPAQTCLGQKEEEDDEVNLSLFGK